MGKRTIVTLLLALTLGIAFAQKFDRAAFYQAMASGKMAEINGLLTEVENSPGNGAYEGALLMRKAGLATIPKTKLKYFKEGRKKFQEAFNADSNNAEYRFLRLGIQENAPKIVKYHSNINADKIFIKEHFKTLPPVVQKAIVAYSKTSKALQPTDF